MAIAETARLIASLELQDKLSPGVNKALGGVGKLEQRVGGLQGKLGNLSGSIRGGISNSLGTFTGRLKGAAGATLGLLGIGGLFTLGAAFKSGIDNAREFGDEVFRLQGITGLAATKTSQLADALGDFGVDSDTALRIAGLFEKNVNTLGGTTKKAQKFQKDYGLSLTDSKGKLLDFNDQLLNSADFFTNKSIPASTKAAALAKIYGRNWQALIPILSQGRDALEKTLGSSLKLSQDDIKAIEANRVATRKWNDAIGDLQVKIGIGLMPTLTELVSTLTGWIETHGDEIQSFAKNAVSTIRGVAGTVLSVVQGIKGVWDSIPGPIKDLLIKGFVAERTVKFLFGFSITGLVKNALGGVAEGLGGALVKAGIGKAFVQPVFVTNQIAGIPGGAPGGGVPPVAGAPGLGLLTGGLALIGVAGIELLIADQIGKGLRTAVTGSDAPLKEDHVVATFGPLEVGLFRSQADILRSNIAPKLANIAKNTSGSPDQRDERQKQALSVAKQLDAKTASLNTKIEDVGATFKNKLEDQKAALARIKERADSNAIYTQNKIAAGTAATQTGAGQIVGAIQRNKPIVNVSVSVVGTSVKVTKTYSQGDMGGGSKDSSHHTGLGGT